MVFPFGFTFREFLWLERVLGPIRAGKRRQDVEAARAEVGEDSLFKESSSGPANVSSFGMCEGVRVLLLGSLAVF